MSVPVEVHEKTYRIVVNVTTDGPCPVTEGPGQGLILGTVLLGAQVEVAEAGPALETGERERRSFQRILEKHIGRQYDLVQRLNDGPLVMGRTKSGRQTQRLTEEMGVLQGLCDAYRLLTGLPSLSAHNIGQRAWVDAEQALKHAEGLL